MKRVYLAGPIANCDDSECCDWRNYASKWLKKRKALGVDPMRRDYRDRDAIQNWQYREIIDLDKKDILEADALLVNWTRISVGTAMECCFAWERHKPIVVVRGAAVPLSPWLLYHSTVIVDTLDEGLAWLDKHIIKDV